MERGIKDAYNGHALYAAPTCLHQVKHEQIRHNVDRGGSVRQARNDLAQAPLGTERKSKVDHINRALSGPLNHLIDASYDGLLSKLYLGQTGRGTIVENADNFRA